MKKLTVAAATFCIVSTACYGGAESGGAEGTDAQTGTAGSASDATAPGTTGVESEAGSATTSAATSGSDGGSDSDTGSEGSSGDPTGGPGGDEPTSDPLDGLPTGDDQWEALCARGHNDAIATAFCAGQTRPSVTSIVELLELIDLGFVPGNFEPGENGNPEVAMAHHSTAVSTQSVNPINPRAFVYSPPVGGVTFPPSGVPDPNLRMMAFARGEPFVELVAKDPVDDALRFYLFRFNLACEDTPQGCTDAELLTPEVESDFVDYSLYDDGDISNTVLDCLQCHQPSGPGTKKMLRMQELEEGWHHWFYPNRPQNLEAIQRFTEAHENESYAGIPAEMLTFAALDQNEGTANPIALFTILHNEGDAPQPNEYFTRPIRTERDAAGCTCNGCGNPPPLQPTNSCSPTWDAIYAESVAGNAIAVPYFDGAIADPAKLATASASYQDTMAGNITPDQMLDIRDVLLDEAAPYMSYAPAPGLDGVGILNHMCRHCHNSSLDQAQSRANFNVETLDTLPQWVKDKAVDRLTRDDDDLRKMPPQRFHQLSDAEIDLVIEVLSP